MKNWYVVIGKVGIDLKVNGLRLINNFDLFDHAGHYFTESLGTTILISVEISIKSVLDI